jgi:peptidoglycan/LPS O-acetylase OafA/YrhL
LDKAKRLDSLTSLRFFAAAAIVALHTSQSFGMYDIANYFPASQAVSFFFVLSGFILSYAYHSLDSNQKIKRFYIARLARVWPLHAATTLTWIAMLAYWNPEGILYQDGLQKLVANIFLLQAWVPLQDWQTSLNGVSWSISVELFFYATFPLILVLFRKHWHWLIIVSSFATIAIIASCYLTSSSSAIQPTNLLYFFPAARLLEFVAGVCAFHFADYLRKHSPDFTTTQWTMLEVAVVITAALTMLMTRSFGIAAVLGPHVATYIKISGAFPAFAALIIIFSFGNGAVSKLLTFKPLVFLGEASFALYLCHYPVLYFIEHSRSAFGSSHVQYFSAWAISITLSCILMLTIERPARKLIMHRHSQTTKNKVAFSLTTATSIVVFSAAMIFTGYSFYREINPPVSFSIQADNIAKFKFGPTIHSIKILQKYSTYSIIEIVTTNRSEKAGVQLAVHLNNASGGIEKNLVPSAIKRSFTDEKFTTSIVVQNKDLELASSIALAAYFDGAPLLKVESADTDWGERRAIFKLTNDAENAPLAVNVTP